MYGTTCNMHRPSSTKVKLQVRRSYSDNEVSVQVLVYNYGIAAVRVMKITQRNVIRRSGCNGAPSLSDMTDFYVNVTETFNDGARVCMNDNRRTLPHGNVLIVTSIDVMVT